MSILGTLVEIVVGGVLLAAWIAAAIAGIAVSALQYVVYRRWIAWPPPNTTFSSWWRRSSRGGHRKPQQVRHAYSRAHV